MNVFAESRETGYENPRFSSGPGEISCVLLKRNQIRVYEGGSYSVETEVSLLLLLCLYSDKSGDLQWPKKLEN